MRHTSGAVDDLVGPVQSHVETASVALKQRSSPVRVGQRQLDGLVDPTGSSGQGRLQHLHPVGGEQHEQIGVLVEAVHRVQQFEEQRTRAAERKLPVLGDQVDVLEHDRRGLQAAGQLERIAEQTQPPACEDDAGAPE